MDGFSALFSEYNILDAFWMTIKLSLIAAVGAALIGLAIAVCRVSPISVLRGFGSAYVTLVRNTPLTLIVFLCVTALYSQMGIYLAPEDSPTSLVDNSFRWALVALSVYHGAFVAEALRSGINTVPPGQAEAARAIGLPFGQTLAEVVLPQALRGAIAPLGNVLIALIKNTTVVATVGVAEASYLMRGMIEFNSSLLIPIFLIMATGFVVLTLPVGIAFTSLSRRLAVVR